MAVSVPASVAEQAERRPIRMRQYLIMTPGRLWVFCSALVVLGLVSGVASLLVVQNRTNLVLETSGRASAPEVSALDIYPSLSDADANAAIGFIAIGPEREVARARYEVDIARAAAAIAVASRDARDDTSVAALATLNSRLPVYTGLVETARALDRQGLPLGVAYLREASALLRDTMLPAAQQVYHAENARVAAAQFPAMVFPWPVMMLSLLTLCCLILAQVFLIQRTHRVVNAGLAIATVAALMSGFWVAKATSSVSAHVETARRDGTQQIELLAQVRIDASRARADEALTLLARGNGQVFEDDFVKTMAAIAGSGSDGGVLDAARRDARDPEHRAVIEQAQEHVRAWQLVHRRTRTLDDSGQYPEAVQVMTGTGPADGNTVFAQLEVAMDRAIADSRATFDRETSLAMRALTRSDLAVAILTLLMAVGILVGLQRRIAEYR